MSTELQSISWPVPLRKKQIFKNLNLLLTCDCDCRLDGGKFGAGEGLQHVMDMEVIINVPKD